MDVAAATTPARRGQRPRRPRSFGLGALVFAGLLAATAAGAVDPSPGAVAEIRIGVLAPEGGSDMLHEWDFVQPYLAQALPDYRVRVESLDIDTLRDVVARSQIDFFIANSGFFVHAQSTFGASAIATVNAPLALSPDLAIGAAIVVLDSRRDLLALSDLKGARIVAVNELAFGGYQVGLHALYRAGVARDELGSMRFVGLPVDQLLEELMSRHADAAILRVCLLEKLAQSSRFPRAAFRVVAQPPFDRFACARSTPLYPDWPIARLKSTDARLAKRVAIALLAMPPTQQGYGWTVATDYNAVHEVFRDLEIGPYEYLNRHTVDGFLRRYRVAIGIAVLLLIAGALHALRVETLVQRRTGELRRMMAERDRIAAEARAREEQFEHLSRLGVLGEMSSMLAHELNQPLSAIANYAHGISRRLASGATDPAPLRQASEQIAHQAERAAGIMQRIRNFARKRSDARATCDLRDAIDAAASLFQGLAPAAGAIERAYDAHCAQGAPAFVDALQIEQVLLNLFKNAHDAMQGVPAAQRRLRVSLDHDEHGYRISVRDSGVGVDAAGTARLFEPFYTTKSQGIGLGLAICKRVVEAHGGRIEASSNAPSSGLTVTFTLPDAEPTGAAADAAPPTRAETTP